MPGDPGWPSDSTWAALNVSVDGRLVATVPLAKPCHEPDYDAAVCKLLQTNWTLPQQHYDSSSSMMAPFYANQSCDPFTPPSTPCKLGNYVDYAIDVASPEHIKAGLAFAQKNNIRLVIRNTGHDYNGKSTGAGALAIWTHHLKSISFLTHHSPTYTGPAIKMGAGVQGFEAYAAAQARNFSVMGGECPTVGLAGGYTQGGGHSALASKYGLAADQALEWEVVTARGEFLRATRTENRDIFWALSGGGGGAYGVVYSLTSKAHPDIPVTGANLTFSSQGLEKDVYYKALSAWHTTLPRMVDAGAMTITFVDKNSFTIAPFTGPGISVEQAQALFDPFLATLKELKIPYNYTPPTLFPGYYAQFQAFMAPIAVGVAQYGGRLIPRSVVENNNEALTAAIRGILETKTPTSFTSVGLNVSKKVAGDVDNAVLPAWRDTLLDAVLTTEWDFKAPLSEMVERQREMTEVLLPPLERLTPGGGCYLNEGDPYQPDWQQTFYGANYNALRAIKKKYDPDDLFYGTTAVGSEEWLVAEGGRLCRAR
ncbi:MAG: hypothetical protein LQ342_004106 [Letrouitia transgressa]|nr:MAG: hypothetical protein LQ342_004106 [Letrouitia transgressa]